MELDTVVCSDALEFMRGLEPDSVDAVITDPPYFKVKPDWWDHQWDDANSFIEWIGQLCQEWQRVLKPNGSLYVFASPQMAARVEVEIARWFNVLNALVWVKNAGWQFKADKEQSRGFLPNTERIIFAEQQIANSSPLANRIKEVREAAGLKGTDIDIALGYVRTKNPKRGTELCRRWEEGSSLPSQEDFINLMKFCGSNDRDLRREYEDLRRPFNITADDQFTDVWFFAPVQSYDGKHPAEKPQDLLRHIIASSTREGAIICDPFCGSGSTFQAARNLRRHYVGCDVDPQWVGYARDRLRMPFEARHVQTETRLDDLPLFAGLADSDG